MNIKILLVLALSVSFLTAHGQKMNSIFNGKNLKGWVAPEGNIWWTAKDGVITGKSGPEKKGTIMWTKKEYVDFVVQADFKMVEGIVDSGIFLCHESLQVQIGISGSMQRDMTGSPYVAGLGYPVEAEGIPDLLRAEDWNIMKVQLVSNELTVWLNGQEVLDYRLEIRPAKGPIGLQIHANNEMAIEFRNIMVGEL